MARSKLADLQEIHCSFGENERRAANLVEQLHTIENREVRTGNALSAVCSQLGEAQADAVRSQEELQDLRRSLCSIIIDVEDPPDAMGDLVSNELRILEDRVLGATTRSLEGLREFLRSAERGDFRQGDFPELRFVVRN